VYIETLVESSVEGLTLILESEEMEDVWEDVVEVVPFAVRKEAVLDQLEGVQYPLVVELGGERFSTIGSTPNVVEFRIAWTRGA
jgi:hypothetical protein